MAPRIMTPGGFHHFLVGFIISWWVSSFPQCTTVHQICFSIWPPEIVPACYKVLYGRLVPKNTWFNWSAAQFGWCEI